MSMRTFLTRLFGTRPAIDLRAPVRNQQRRFGSVNEYFVATVADPAGRERKALFTRNEVLGAIRRGRLNPEDVA